MKRCTCNIENNSIKKIKQNSFTINDPIHGFIYLPEIVKIVTDTFLFQRLRHIKQLGLLYLVFPGATHNRFSHSIGTAFLANEFIKILKYKQPEFEISDKDTLCIILASLCHDLGHSCYSHLFELFIHTIGKELESSLYLEWNHEKASIMLLELLFNELKEPLKEYELEDNDYIFIKELINPPSKLKELLDQKRLFLEWSNIITGRSVDKAWMYEIVSNWRTNIDVDKFDYFKRDCFYLGIKQQFDYNRYMNNVKIILDDCYVPTISPSEKLQDSIHDMINLRKTLHLEAYQNKTVKKLECHMIDILKQMDNIIRITDKNGKKIKMSEAAVNLDPVAYPFITDTFIESKLLNNEYKSYEKYFIKRKLMRMIASWDVNNLNNNNNIIEEVLKYYNDSSEIIKPVFKTELRCSIVNIESDDRFLYILFHDKKGNILSNNYKVKPLRQKLFLFYNSDSEDEVTLNLLKDSFKKWVNI